MQETQVRSLGQEDPLEKEMATHSSILAWKIPWTEDPGRLQYMGSQRVRHDWATSLHKDFKLSFKIYPINSKVVKFSLQKVSRVLIKHHQHGQSGLQVVPDPLLYSYPVLYHGGFPGGSDSKESACNAGDLGLIPGSGRSPGEGNGNTLQYSCLDNFMDRETWWATVHGVTESRTWLSN